MVVPFRHFIMPDREAHPHRGPHMGHERAFVADPCAVGGAEGSGFFREDGLRRGAKCLWGACLYLLDLGQAGQDLLGSRFRVFDTGGFKARAPT